MSHFRIGIAWISLCAKAVLGVACGMCFIALLSLLQIAKAADDLYAEPRALMVETIKSHSRYSVSALGRGYLDSRVLNVMGTVPRHEFLAKQPSGALGRFYDLLSGGGTERIAYADRPLPIGYIQHPA